eukprot:1446448-Alexandrium_andersonii.AAC.1
MAPLREAPCARCPGPSATQRQLSVISPAGWPSQVQGGLFYHPQLKSVRLDGMARWVAAPSGTLAKKARRDRLALEGV